MASGLASGISSGLGQSLGTSAAGSAAGQAAAQTAGESVMGQLGSALGSELGQSANKGLAGDATRMIDHGSMDAATQAASPDNSKGGWLGMGLFGNDKYNPNPSSYAPATGTQVSQAAMPRAPKPNSSIALSMLGALPVTDPSIWKV